MQSPGEAASYFVSKRFKVMPCFDPETLNISQSNIISMEPPGDRLHRVAVEPQPVIGAIHKPDSDSYTSLAANPFSSFSSRRTTFLLN